MERTVSPGWILALQPDPVEKSVSAERALEG